MNAPEAGAPRPSVLPCDFMPDLGSISNILEQHGVKPAIPKRGPVTVTMPAQSLCALVTILGHHLLEESKAHEQRVWRRDFWSIHAISKSGLLEQIRWEVTQ